MKKVLLLALLVAGCAHAPLPPPEPVIKTVTVKVPVQVDCPAMQELGLEPEYPDTDAALKAAPDIFYRVRLLVQGRLLRAARLTRYLAARNSC